VSLAAFLAKAASQVGYVEGGGSTGRNGNITRYGAWYGLNGEPYCDMGLSWVGAQVGESAAVGKFAYCPAHALWFQRRGQWGHTPRVGAFVFYTFGSSIPIHVGVVEKVLPGNRIQTIEFNTSASNAGSQNNGGGCYRRVRTAGWGIYGYGYPAYGHAPTPVSRSVNRTPPNKVAEDGVFGPGTIRKTQAWCHTGVDGVWGPGSKRALQHKVGAAADGVIGPDTIGRLQHVVGAARDGKWGPGTTRALQHFLNTH
jgi:hypothetical protein